MPKRNLEKLLLELVALSRTGRPLQGIGQVLQARERKQGTIVYRLLARGRVPAKALPVSAHLTLLKEPPQKYALGEAVRWFIEKYPAQARPLVERLAKRNDCAQELVYGLKRGEGLPEEYYAAVIAPILHLSKERALFLYRDIIAPYHQSKEEKSMLVKVIFQR